MKRYSVHLTQNFEETISVEANSEEEAEAKAREEWESGVGAEVTIHSITEEN